MADETKTQIPKPTRQRGPMGRMGGMRRGEKAKDFKGTMRQLLGYIGQHKIAVFAAVAFAVCSVIFNIVGPKVLGQVTTKLFEGLVAKVNGTGDVDFDWIAKTLGFLLCLYLASSVCSLIQGWLMTGVTQKICYRMRKEIAAKIAVVPMSYFNGHSKGDVLSRITNDVDTLGQSLNQSVTQLITSVTQIIGVLVMMLSISLPLTGVTVLTLPAAAIILTVMIHFSQPYFREQQQVLGAVNGIIEEDFAGQNVIQVFDRAEASIEEFDRQNDRLFISGWRSQFLSGLMMPLMSLVGNMGYVGVVVVGAQLALTGNATPGDIQSFIQYVRNFTQPVQQLGNVSNTMQSMAAATERVFEFLAAPEEEQKADAQIPEKRPGHVVFDHVKFGYTPDKIIIHYKDAATAFNNIKKATIENKGVLNNAISTLIFKELQKAGIKTHYIETINDRDQICRKVTIIPLEVIVRNIIAGSMAQRLGIEHHLRHLLQEGRTGRPADQRPPRRSAGRRDLRRAGSDLRHDFAHQRSAAEHVRQDEHQPRGLQDRVRPHVGRRDRPRRRGVARHLPSVGHVHQRETR